ncbi:hypothetical protein KJ359_013116 [Pestalotiopsis sp. 9143b]|nr:hypothetical protein KJ359_013116 [Pestalotiopsis sp. 9143b]
MSNSKLANLNSATLGAKMPEITLPDGSVVQTGTVGQAYNEAHASGDEDKKAKLKEAMAATLPMLKKVGFFDLFTPEEWIQGDNEGRKVVGKLALESS